MEQRFDWGRDGTQAMRATGLIRGAEILWREAERKKETCDGSLRLRGSWLARWGTRPTKIVPSRSELRGAEWSWSSAARGQAAVKDGRRSCRMARYKRRCGSVVAKLGRECCDSRGS